MRTRAARWIMGAFLVAYTFALTWPGLLLADRVEPMILGLPFLIAWVGFWVASGLATLFVIDRIETRARLAEGSAHPQAAGGADHVSGATEA